MRDLSNAKVIAVRSIIYSGPWKLRGRENRGVEGFFIYPEGTAHMGSQEYYETSDELDVMVVEEFPKPTFKELAEHAYVIMFRDKEHRERHVAIRDEEQKECWKVTGFFFCEDEGFMDDYADLSTIEGLA